MALLDMFRSRDSGLPDEQAATTQIDRQVTVIERPKPMRPLDERVPEKYLELACSLDFLPGELLEKQVLQFLFEQQIPIYDYDEVSEYMTAEAEKVGSRFIWRPLRNRDALIMGGWHWGSGEKHDCYQPGTDPFGRLIPAHILGDVKAIQDRFGDKVCFFVTDIGEPDPFICVSAPSTMDQIIFGCWDEPGFGVV